MGYSPYQLVQDLFHQQYFAPSQKRHTHDAMPYSITFLSSSIPSKNEKQCFSVPASLASHLQKPWCSQISSGWEAFMDKNHWKLFGNGKREHLKSHDFSWWVLSKKNNTNAKSLKHFETTPKNNNVRYDQRTACSCRRLASEGFCLEKPSWHIWHFS